eukprot:4536838-Pleurochrysis_carterae.AAC.1
MPPLTPARRSLASAPTPQTYGCSACSEANSPKLSHPHELISCPTRAAWCTRTSSGHSLAPVTAGSSTSWYLSRTTRALRCPILCKPNRKRRPTYTSSSHPLPRSSMRTNPNLTDS